ncbi:sulfotransferase [Nocardioides bizhenqiangii]|uniref:Sulfotransferase n=1 Tax=Nocardioides bizhenqiangii TaxID=3095076 RepID=A0ABZ0ZUA0_9ACTN|nr:MULTISPECIES: sulfotransferase [unclassified Nocardioides]MDZ5623583.1 sulfotransferase [Nocardioides sp. HM23]WQQ27807.1 sulfotransferase [Nocardioides sp. HM61]
MDYVFVVTYGRSGSTLVQGILNAMPRTLVRGENGLYVQHLFRAWQAADGIREKRKGRSAHRASNAFFGINALTRGRFVRSAQRLVVGGILGKHDQKDYDRIGFKEVLWHQVAPDETEPFFAWLDEVCPGAKYVLNSRDIEQVVGSGFWQRQDADAAMAAIRRVIEIQDHLRATRPDRVHETRYEVITGDDRAASDAALRGLAEFVVGSCDDALLETLRGTLEVGHGPNPFGKSRRDKKGA